MIKMKPNQLQPDSQCSSGLSKATRLVAYCVVASVLIIIVACLITNLLFSIKAPHEFLVAHFSSDGLLGLFGSIASGAMAICIAILSYRQADLFERQRSEWQREKDHFEAINIKRPFLVLRTASLNDNTLEGWRDEKGAWHFETSEAFRKVSLSLENVGEGPACNTSIIDDVAFGEPPVLSQPRAIIPPNEVMTFEIEARDISEHGDTTLEVSYSNILGCRYIQSLTFSHDEVPVSEGTGMDDSGEVNECAGDYRTLIDISSLSFQEERPKMK